MSKPYDVTFVEAELRRRRRRRRPLTLIGGLLALALLVSLVVGVVGGIYVMLESTPHYDDPVEHFKYGSIGSEPASGIPYNVWQALPELFPETFGSQGDYSAFGFLYESSDGKRRDLPIGISKRRFRGVDVVWFNCAVCHTGTYRESAGSERRIVAGMPSNNLDLNRFIDFLLEISTDDRLSPEKLVPAVEKTDDDFGFIDRLMLTYLVAPKLREGLITLRSQLVPLLTPQPRWGPGRVDTFNPYKVTKGGWSATAGATNPLSAAERIGTADFPSIFLQRPRHGMNLHWDGNNSSLAERNLSAAIGAGVTPDTVDHVAIGRIADWLLDLPPPPTPHRPDQSAVERGQAIYDKSCASCHGKTKPGGYDFTGSRLGLIEPIERIGTDGYRLDSYTEAFHDWQLENLFAGTRHQFKFFKKTEGYANMPLDGLWLRGPYLHTGSVPTLASLLDPPEARPKAFIRGSDVVDPVNGGFLSPPCVPGEPVAGGICFDTMLPGNRSSGHDYGTSLDPSAKLDLLSYLLTF